MVFAGSNGTSRLVAFALLLGGAAGCSDSGASEGDETRFCATFAANMVDLTGVGVEVEPSAVRASADRVGAPLDRLEAQAPQPIRADMKTYAGYLRSYYKVLGKYGYDYQRLFHEGTAAELAMGSDPATIAAYERLGAYIEANCPGVSVPDHQ